MNIKMEMQKSIIGITTSQKPKLVIKRYNIKDIGIKTEPKLLALEKLNSQMAKYIKV